MWSAAQVQACFYFLQTSLGEVGSSSFPHLRLEINRKQFHASVLIGGFWYSAFCFLRNSEHVFCPSTNKIDGQSIF